MVENSKKTRLILKGAIAIIIIMALYLLLIFYMSTIGPSALNPAPTNCFPNAGFSCTNLTYNPSTENVTFIFNQHTINNWSNVEIIFVPSGTQFLNETPNISWNSTEAIQIKGALLQNNNVIISVPINETTLAKAHGAGSIWARYYITNNETVQYTEISLISIRTS